MNLGRRRLIALVGLLVAALAPAWTAAEPATAGPVERAPKVERYLYSATFEADVTHGRRNVYPGPNNFDTENLSASVAGRLPNLEVSTKDAWKFVPRGTRSSVKVVRAEATTTKSTDDGRMVDRCTAKSARPQGFSYHSHLGFVVPYGALHFPASCSDSEGKVSKADLTLPVIWGKIIRSSQIIPGEVSKSFKFRGDSKDGPEGRDETACPGYAKGSTVSCAYKIQGTLTLKLIKKLPQPKPKGASISKGASKVATTLSCTRNCTITIRLTPLAGGPTLTVRRLSPAPTKPTKVTVPIPAGKRKAVKRSGGVRMKVTYQVAGLSFSETRIARL